jgi:hypothetical protein
MHDVDAALGKRIEALAKHAILCDAADVLNLAELALSLQMWCFGHVYSLKASPC